MGITHVLNAAEGDWEGSVDLSQEHYAGTGIKYLGLPLWDDVNARILPYLGCANEFIASAFNVSLFSFSRDCIIAGRSRRRGNLNFTLWGTMRQPRSSKEMGFFKSELPLLW